MLPLTISESEVLRILQDLIYDKILRVSRQLTVEECNLILDILDKKDKINETKYRNKGEKANG